MLSTGSRRLDALLKGGLEPPAILELVGPQSSGKTQLCHQLAVMVQLPRERGGLSGKALYIDAEGTFRPERVISIARYRGLDPEKALESIEYVEAGDLDGIAEAVVSLGGLDVSLVVIDSLAYALLSPKGVREARRAFGRVAELLKRLALWGGVAVVTSAARGGRVVGDPYVSMWVDFRVRLKPLGGGLVEASLEIPRSADSCRLAIAEGGVLDYE